MTSFDVVREIVAAHFGTTPPLLTSDMRFSGALDGDDFDRIEIVMAIEEQLGVRLDDDEFQDFDTIGELAELVDRKCGIAPRRQHIEGVAYE